MNTGKELIFKHKSMKYVGGEKKVPKVQGWSYG